MELARYLEKSKDDWMDGLFRMVAFDWANESELTVCYRFSPWEPGPRREEQLIIVRYEDVVDAQLNIVPYNPPGELEVLAEDPILQEWGPRGRLVIKEPLPRPDSFFMMFCSIVHELTGDPTRVFEYLPYFSELPMWLDRMSAGPMPLVDAPYPIAKASASLVRPQGVNFDIEEYHLDKQLQMKDLRISRLNTSWIVHRRAVLETPVELGAAA